MPMCLVRLHRKHTAHTQATSDCRNKTTHAEFYQSVLEIEESQTGYANMHALDQEAKCECSLFKFCSLRHSIYAMRNVLNFMCPTRRATHTHIQFSNCNMRFGCLCLSVSTTMEAPQMDHRYLHTDNEYCAQCELTGMVQTVHSNWYGLVTRWSAMLSNLATIFGWRRVENNLLNIFESGKSTAWHRISRATKSFSTSNEILSMAFSYRWSDQRRTFYSDKLQLECNSSSWWARAEKRTDVSWHSIRTIRVYWHKIWEELFSQSAVGTHSAPMRTTMSTQMLRKTSNIDLEHFSLLPTPPHGVHQPSAPLDTIQINRMDCTR